MSVVRREAFRRWATVLAGTGLLAAIPSILAARPVAASALSPQVVVAEALASAKVAHQGLVQIDASFGLPALPVVSDETKILAGSTRVRTWWSSSRSWRVDTLSATGEEIAIADPTNSGGGLRQWSFENNTVTEVLYRPAVRLPRADDLVPPQATRRVLGWLGPQDRVVSLGARRVAGINAAGARIVAGDVSSTVGHIDLWIDPASGLPLELDVFARGGSRPVLSSRFLDVDLARPSPGVLSPSLISTAQQDSTTEPDLLARVNSFGTVPLPDHLGKLAAVTGPAAAGLQGVALYGLGLTRILVVPLPDRLAGDVFEATGSKGITVHLVGGDATLLSTALLTVAVVRGAEQGYLVAGTVGPSALKAAVAALLATP